MYAYLISKESSEESYDLYQNDFDSIPSGSLPEDLVTISGNPSVDTAIRLSLESGTNGKWFKVLDVPAGEQEYVVYMTNPGTGFTNAKLGFFLGKANDNSVPATYIIDDVIVELVAHRKDNDNPIISGATPMEVGQGYDVDPLSGVSVFDLSDPYLSVDDIEAEPPAGFDNTVSGEYAFTLTLKDRAGNETVVTRTIVIVEGLTPSRLKVINGDFEIDQLAPIPQSADTGWGWHGAGKFTVDIPGGPDGKATINVTNPGTVPHAVQFYQQNKYIEANAIYKFKFTMKAETATNIRLSLEAGTTLRDFKIVPITTTMETYEFYMTPSGGSFTNAKIAFFLGKVDANSVANIYEIDDVSFELAGYAEPFGQTNFLGVDNKEIVVGTAFDKLAGVTILWLLWCIIKTNWCRSWRRSRCQHRRYLHTYI